MIYLFYYDEISKSYTQTNLNKRLKEHLDQFGRITVFNYKAKNNESVVKKQNLLRVEAKDIYFKQQVVIKILNDNRKLYKNDINKFDVNNHLEYFV